MKNKITDRDRKINYIKFQINQCKEDIKQAKKLKQPYICYAHRMEAMNELVDELNQYSITAN